MPVKRVSFIRNISKGADNFQAVFFDLMYPMYQFKLEQRQVTKDSPIFVYGGTLESSFRP